MLTPNDMTEAGFYWYLDAIGSAPQVVEVVGDNVLMVRFAGREEEDALSDLAGTARCGPPEPIRPSATSSTRQYRPHSPGTAPG